MGSGDHSKCDRRRVTVTCIVLPSTTPMTTSPRTMMLNSPNRSTSDEVSPSPSPAVRSRVSSRSPPSTHATTIKAQIASRIASSTEKLAAIAKTVRSIPEMYLEVVGRYRGPDRLVGRRTAAM